MTLQESAFDDEKVVDNLLENLEHNMKHYFLAAAIYICGFSILAADFEVEAAIIKSVIMKSQEHWNARDMVKFSQAYTESATFINIFGETYFGSQAISERQLRVHEDPEARLIIDSIHVRKIEANSAITTSRWRIENSTNTINGIWTQIFIKRNDDWLVDYAHNQKVDLY